MSVFILTGAGVSAESGLPTFRDPDGLWETHSPYDLATPEAFARNPELVQRFYNARRRALQDVAPNAAHLALAGFAKAMRNRGEEAFLCTQNVDDLHERAGSRDALHMHGELCKARCLACAEASVWRDDIAADSRCPACGAAALRPHVVWFGEIPFGLERIEAALDRADVFVSIGTSGSVHPAASFVVAARRAGARTIEANIERSEVSHLFDERRIGPAAEAIPALLDELLALGG